MNFEALFNPKSIAIIGASSREKTVGNDVVKNLKKQGYQGKIIPINPKIDELYGLPVTHDITEVDEKIDLVVVAIPAKFVPAAVAEAAKKGAEAAVVISAGFKEVGNHQLEAELLKVCRENNVILVGPNCLGIVNPLVSMNASFAAVMPPVGDVAFMSQSGALCTAVLDYAKEMGMGFSKFISIGNKAALNELDLIKYFHEDPNTRVIAMYSEALENAPEMVKALQELNKSANPKPVIILKSGKTDAGSAAIASHTGSLSSGDAAYEALFAQAGIIRAESISQLFDYAQIFSFNKLQEVNKVTIITNAGGPGVLTTDEVIDSGLEMTKLTDETVTKLREFLPAAASTANPVDVLGDAPGETYKKTLEVVVEDKNTDAIILLLTPQSMTEPVATAEAVIEMRKNSDKAIVISLMGKELVADGLNLLRKAKVAVTSFPEPAAKSLAILGQFTSWANTPKEEVLHFNDTDKDKVAKIFADAKKSGKTSFPEAEAMEIMKAYNFPLLRSAVASSADEAQKIMDEYDCKVAMKIVSQDILHKSDVGGVMLNVTKEDIKAKYEEMMTTVAKNKPEAKLDGVLLMEMAPKGTEVILGVNKNSLGTMIMFGLGGIYVEVLKDVNFAFAPLTRGDALRMIETLRTSEIFEGVRGEAPVDKETLVESIGRLAQLVTDFPEITELDINPLLASSEGAKVLDVRVVIEG